jgi:hypothetical protein
MTEAWLRPYVYRPAAEIPRRQFLYGRHYIRGFISTTIAPGGVGKTGLTIVEALAMATAKPLLGVQVPERLRVGYWNGEDPLEETERRIAAAVMRYGLDGRELEGWLFWGSGRDAALTIATQGRNGAEVSESEVERVTQAASALDVLIIDPFISSHRVVENDNGAMDLVAKRWAKIAHDANVAVDLPHHPRKNGGAEVTVEDGRGASALLAAARSARVLNTMSEAEALKAGIERRKAYFKVENGKANLAPPPDGAAWFRFASVSLGNGPDGGDGDSVGVVEPWRWPDPFDGIGAAETFKVQEAIEAGNYRESVQAKDWAGHAVAEVLRLDAADPADKAKIKGLLKTWLQSGVLIAELRPDANGDHRPFITVGKWVTP